MVISSRGVFGLRYNPASRRRFVVSVVTGHDWTLLGDRDLGDGCEPGDPQFLAWLVELIGPAAGGER
jgi:hypothetical protein